jgi:triphosphatase
MGADRQEVEWQYDAPGGLKRAEEWLGGDGPGSFGITVVGSSRKALTDTYYDTRDRRLHRAGYALRIRRKAPDGGFEATMKSLVPAEGNLHRRREISEPLEDDEVAALQGASGRVGERLKTLVSPHELRPIFEVHTRRRTFDLLLSRQDEGAGNTKAGVAADAVRAGEVALDDSKIPLGAGSPPARLVRVEVEVDASVATAFSRLEGFAKAMEETLGLRPATISKYEAGLFATGQNPNDRMLGET